MEDPGTDLNAGESDLEKVRGTVLAHGAEGDVVDPEVSRSR